MASSVSAADGLRTHTKSTSSRDTDNIMGRDYGDDNGELVEEEVCIMIED
ncbi:MAG: hypothetical protein ACTSVD_06650 [Candidatus Thorarchaeota archaeon]